VIAISDILTCCISDESMPCEVCCGEGYAVATIEGKLRCSRCAERWHRIHDREMPKGWAGDAMEEIEYKIAELVMRDERLRQADDEYGIWGFR